MNKKEYIEDQIAIKLWYAGLGELWYKTRSRFATAGCHDSHRYRMLYYIVVGAIGFMMSISLFYFAWFIHEFLWLTTISIIIGFLCLIITMALFQATLQLFKAIKTGFNTDLADPCRMRTIKRAVKWGKRKGYIYKDPHGSWYFINKESS